MKFRPCISLFAVSLMAVAGVSFACPRAATNSAPGPGKEAALTALEVGNQLLPDKVFFRGQVATVQDRNTGGVHYAGGFLVFAGLKFVVMDIGANEILQAGSTRDTQLKHPVPLQFTGSSGAGNCRLYRSRDHVEFHRAK